MIWYDNVYDNINDNDIINVCINENDNISNVK